MPRRPTPPLTRTPSIPALTPEDRVSNFSAPSTAGPYEGGDDDMEWELPVEVADADERFAQWYTGRFDVMADSDAAVKNEAEGGVKSQRGRKRAAPIPRVTKSKQVKRSQNGGTAKRDKPTVLTKRKQTAAPGVADRKAKKTAVNKLPPSPRTLGEAMVLRRRTYYPRRAKTAAEPVTGVPTSPPATESTLPQPAPPPYGRRAPAPRTGKGIARMGTTRS